MRVVFMGTPDFAVPALQTLIAADDVDVIAVITQPDRPAGRGKQLRPSPVKQVALDHDLPVFQPEKLRGKEVYAQLEAWQPDFHVVAAYGQILRQKALDMPTYGSINVHASLLPRWRGAAPIQASILHGDKETGVTIMQMDIGLDTGDMLKKGVVEITEQDTGQSLHDKLATIGGPLLLDTLRGIVAGNISPEKQNDDLATYAPRIEKEDGRLNWVHSCIDIDRRVRAFYPWPGTFTDWDGQMLKIIAGQPIQDVEIAAGTVKVNHRGYDLLIGCGEGSFAPTTLQIAGRKAMHVNDFLNGFAEIDGTTLGTTTP